LFVLIEERNLLLVHVIFWVASCRRSNSGIGMHPTSLSTETVVVDC